MNLAPEAPSSHRERKKARTRAALIEVSQRLFADHGYAETTLEQICAEVDVRPQTLLRYFDSKAHLALAPMTDPLELLRAYLEAPDRPVDTLTAWRHYMTLECQEVLAPTSDAIASYVTNLRSFQEWGRRDPVLVAMLSDVERRLRDLLAASLAADARSTGPEPGSGDLHATLVAALLVAGRTAVYQRWLAVDRPPAEPDALLDEQLAVIDYAVRSLPRPARP